MKYQNGIAPLPSNVVLLHLVGALVSMVGKVQFGNVSVVLVLLNHEPSLFLKLKFPRSLIHSTFNNESLVIPGYLTSDCTSSIM